VFVLQYLKTMELLRGNFEFLKHIYLQNACESTYQFINWIKIGEFAEETQIVDKDLKLAKLDLIFVATNNKPAKD
jgi:hypothetical protein